MYKNIKVIGFDADDTLWVNEPYYKEIESQFCKLLIEYLPAEKVSKILFDMEMANLELYGYGLKSFTLSLIETAIKISDSKVSPQVIQEIINLGKEALSKDIELLRGVDKVFEALSAKSYRLIVATKGDLLDQERKLKKSGLEQYFHHIEIMSDKKESDYLKLIKHLDITPQEFVMVGNSLKSDILPVLNINGRAIHVPYHTTWAHEHVSEKELKNKGFDSVNLISDILNYF